MRFAAAAAVLIFVLTVPAHAQVAGGTVSGKVTVESGAALPGAQISIQHASTGLVRNAATNSDGIYRFPDLPDGNYEMTASVSGFVTEVWTGIGVTGGVERVLNVVMHPGKPEQIIRAVAPAAEISQACPTACGTANTATVQDTPLNGRDWAALTTLQAGVTGVQTGNSSGGGGNTDRGFGAPVSISGSRPDENSYRLDGISINDYANGAPGSVLGDNLGIDAVQQVSVLGSNYPAEYGRTSGGVINVQTRSGTNSFHGSVYEFLRNSALDARNFFDGPVIPPFKRNQFGSSGGLPIQKNRTFIFGDYEGLRQSLGLTTLTTVPSQAARNGQLSTGAVTVDPAVARYLAAFYPLPNGRLLGAGNTGIYAFAAQQVTDENYFTIRFDHKFSDHDSLYATYTRDASETIQPNAFGEFFSTIVSSRQAATVHEQHIFNSNSLTAGRIGFDRAIGVVGGIDRVLNPLMKDPSYGFEPGGFAGSVRQVPGLTTFPGAPTAQGLLSSSRRVFWNSFQGGDDVFLTRGVHLLKFGFEVERMQDNELTLSSVNGTFRFDSLQQYLTNQPSAFAGLASPNVPEFGVRQTLFGGYAQDDIRLKKTLTINAGLRYEMVTVPSDAHGRTSALHNLTTGDLAEVITSVGTPLFRNPTLRNFEPRVGFAWNPRGGKTLIRAGFGVFDVLPLPYVYTLTYPGAEPFVQRIIANTLSPGMFPTGAYDQFSTDTHTSLAYYPDPKPKRNYVMQWNLSVARELTSTLALTVGYVGSRGVHLPYRVDNMSMVLPTLTSAGYLYPIPNSAPPPPSGICADGSAPGPNGCPWPTLNPNFGRIPGTLSQANSFYDALQVDVTKRLSHGFQIHGAFTWGKSIDTLSATESDDAFPNGLFNQLFFDQRTTRGLSDFNVARTLVLNFTWQIPAPRTDSRAAGWLSSGWQLSALYKASTGQPFTPILGGDPLGTNLDQTGEVPSRVPGCDLVNSNFKKDPSGPIYINAACFILPQPTAAIAAQCQPFGFRAGAPIAGTCTNLRGDLGRNVVIGPDLSKLDFSVFRNNRVKRISETFNAQFRAEIFNIFNRANFASPTDNLAAFDQNGQPISSAGLIDSTQTTSRQIQFALKLIW
jgi:Carboxypeptidase regulatory-like domain/TonB dependent receptor